MSIRKEAERYIAAEALNVTNEFENAARIMSGLLAEIRKLEAELERKK